MPSNLVLLRRYLFTRSGEATQCRTVLTLL
jgi:hypothetical protein